ncbi:hypothetical protein M9Y10_005148 [Tritrichomonas musculus]|uniref:Protein kinase domain-containing protein n=1 Tax=Tritrichomonas musculus TaxID=1915356 RepID=A0ABR2JMR7_9EUKA
MDHSITSFRDNSSLSLSSTHPLSSLASSGRMLVSIPHQSDLLLEKEYHPIKVIGQGVFGIVYMSKEQDGQCVAVKKVLQDRRYKSREVEIMEEITRKYKSMHKSDEIQDIQINKHNINCCLFRNCFKTQGRRQNEVYLNIVMDYMPMSLHQFNLYYRKKSQYPPLLYVKLFAFQIFAALNVMHSLSIMHRDVKPNNILVDKDSGELKFCDFGSSKKYIPGEKSLTYISSRYYRAPELMYECELYTPSVDIWGAGCTIVELLMAGIPLFQGKSSIDQLFSIIKVIGEPTKDDLLSFKRSIDIEIPSFDKDEYTPLDTLLPRHTPKDLYDLLILIFQFNPNKRPSAIECMHHRCFDILFNPELKMPSGKPFPSLDRCL